MTSMTSRNGKPKAAKRRSSRWLFFILVCIVGSCALSYVASAWNTTLPSHPITALPYLPTTTEGGYESEWMSSSCSTNPSAGDPQSSTRFFDRSASFDTILRKIEPMHPVAALAILFASFLSVAGAVSFLPSCRQRGVGRHIDQHEENEPELDHEQDSDSSSSDSEPESEVLRVAMLGSPTARRDAKKLVKKALGEDYTLQWCTADEDVHYLIGAIETSESRLDERCKMDCASAALAGADVVCVIMRQQTDLCRADTAVLEALFNEHNHDVLILGAAFMGRKMVPVNEEDGRIDPCRALRYLVNEENGKKKA